MVDGTGKVGSTLGSEGTDMHRFVANENIRRFKEQLGNCSDERLKDTLEQLLAAEQGKLKGLLRNCR